MTGQCVSEARWNRQLRPGYEDREETQGQKMHGQEEREEEETGGVQLLLGVMLH
jgi:hypothetical protein